MIQRIRIENADQFSAIYKTFLSLSRQLIPAMAIVTLSLLFIFAYFQMRTPEADLYHAYDGIFASDGYSNLPLIVEQDDITNETVIRAIAERDAHDPGIVDFK